MATFDLVIRNGLVYDGSGMPPQRADVGVRGGRVAAVGPLGAAESAATVDAAGKAVAPGFIDVHTHFDAQFSWDGQIRPMMQHGVTTVVPGNCSLTLAPLKEEMRGRLCRMFRQIEDLPMAAFDEGIDWKWETYPDWIAAIESGLAANVAPLVGHSAIRMWVMGEDSFHREATEDEVRAMQEVLAECLHAGASGLSTSYVDMDENFKPVPSRLAAHSEIEALAATLGEVGHGILQIVPEFYDTTMMCRRVDMLADLSLAYGIPTTLSPLFDSRATPDLVPTVMAKVEERMAEGARVWPQVQTRPIDINFRIRERNFMMIGMPTWFRVLHLPTHEDKLAAYRDDATRAQLVAEACPENVEAMQRRMARVYVRGVGRDALADLLGRSLGEIAEERGCNPVEAMIQIALEDDLATEFKNDSLGHDDPEVVGELLAHDHVLVGASDGGAHVQAFATYGDTGFLFERYVRETGSMSVAKAVRRITHEPALAWGMADRGLLSPGYAADVCIFDPATIARGEEVGAEDLPGQGYRYVRHGEGIDTVIVNGEVSWSADSGYTDARAGRIVTRETPQAV